MHIGRRAPREVSLGRLRSEGLVLGRADGSPHKSGSASLIGGLVGGLVGVALVVGIGYVLWKTRWAERPRMTEQVAQATEERGPMDRAC